MVKGYMIYKCEPGSDVSEDVKVVLDIKKGKDFVKKMNKPREEEEKLLEQCDLCIKDNCHTEERFTLRKCCNRANIKNDRYGVYCENSIEDYYELRTTEYYGREIEVEE